MAGAGLRRTRQEEAEETPSRSFPAKRKWQPQRGQAMKGRLDDRSHHCTWAAGRCPQVGREDCPAGPSARWEQAQEMPALKAGGRGPSDGKRWTFPVDALGDLFSHN